jgi:DNA-binding SARP family transcriptional activator
MLAVFEGVERSAVGDLRTEFKILGSLEAVVAGRRVSVDSGKLRVLLAGLVLRANQVVGMDQLIDWLWEDDPLVNPRGAVHTYVRRLRQALGNPDLLSTISNGYRLNLAPDELDLLRFRDLVGRADRTSDVAAQAGLLIEALALWRGPVLADIPSEALRRDAVADLDEERLTALEWRFDVELRLGRHSGLVRDLRAAAIDNPYRERFWAQLMLALYRAGRQAESLDVYQQVRDLLVEHLGIEPGASLRTLHERILVSDPVLAVADFGQLGGAVATVPAQLPPDVIGFVGRQGLVERVGAMLRPVGSRTGVPIVVLSGPPGIGKTALAVYAGHQIRSEFPDGQLYVNLRGYDHERAGQDPPLTPVQVLSQFLRGLGVSADQIPVELDEQVNLFRSKVAGKHVLIVLDNASHVDQVRPLIPGDAGCSVLVTSRHQLRSLVASNGAHMLHVDTLSRAESEALLSGMLTSAAIDFDAAVIPEVADLCGHLPLALRIAAANLMNVPSDHFDSYIADLREGNRLAALSVEDDRQVAVSATIALSYHAIEPDDRRIFRYLSLFPGTDFAAAAVAVLADTSTAQAQNSLNRLTSANLIQHHAPGRYQFHDLLRQYARERVEAEDSSQHRDQAVTRLGQWYLHAAHNAADVLHNEFVRLALPPRIAAADRFSNESQAMAWLIAERRNLIATVQYFAKHEPKHLSWSLADALRGFFWTGKYRTEWLEASRAGLQAARDDGDQHGVASMARSLANLYNTLGNYQIALTFHQESLRVHQKLGMHEEAAATLNNISLAYLSLGRMDDADRSGREALVIAQEIGSRRAESATLGLLGSIHWTRGQMSEATVCLKASLDMANELGLHHISSYGLRNLGLVCLALGDLQDARSYFEQAFEVSERIGSFYDKSIALYGLALAHRDTGNYDVALDFAEQALVAFGECGDRTYEVETLCAISTIASDLDDWAGAGQYARSALEEARQIDYVDGEASALARLAAVEFRSGRPEEALRHSASAYALVDGRVNRITEGKVLVELAGIYLGHGAHELSLECAERAVAVCGQTGQRLGTARALRVLGMARHAVADFDRAHECWREALKIFEEVGTPDADAVRELLDTVGTRSS